jgi:hypothetical protein
MSHTPVRCEHDGIKWFPRGTVEKYSPDQSSWAEARLAEELSWGRRPLVARFGLNRLLGRQIQPVRLHGDWLRDIFSGPEDGYAYCQGNNLVNGGLDKLAAILVATAPTTSPGPLLPNAQAIGGVGSNTGAMTPTSTALLGDGSTTTAWYQGFDATFPSVDGTVHGQLDGQWTVTGSNANFNWQEWCWASTTTGTITPGGTLASVTTGTETMFNRWEGTSLGTKGSGATWVFSTTITFS